MKTRTIGMLIIVVGIIMLLYTGFNYLTTEKVAEIGSLKITQEKSHSIHWSPIIGAVLIVGGIVIAIRDKKV